MMVPPFRVHGNGFTPQHSTAEAKSGHNTNQTHQAHFFFFFWRGSASEDQTYRWLPVTITIITSQHNFITFPRLHFQEGMRGGRGKGGGGMSLFVHFTTWKMWHAALSQV